MNNSPPDSGTASENPPSPISLTGKIVGRFVRLFSANLSFAVRRRAFFECLAILGAVGLIGLTLLTLLLIPFTPSIADLQKAKFEKPSVLMSVDGKRLATYKQFNREWVPLSKISPHTVQALIATEDHRFYQHHGVDFYRLGGALLSTLGGNLQGGSTLTQQLARNLYPNEIGRSVSIVRKIKETITAFKIEHAFTKKEILETYLNTVPFLYNAFGIEMAARTYFDKPAGKLTIGESATLIGMLKGTSYYNPVFNLERATARRNVVLSQMVKRGVLSQSAFDNLKRRPINLNFERQLEARGIAPHFAEHVRKWLVTWADRNDYNIYTDGLKIYTTIDSRLQAAAVQAVRRRANALQSVADVEWAQSSQRLLSTSTGPYAAMHPRITPFAHFWSANDALVEAFIRESAAYRNAVAAGDDPAATLTKLKQDSNFIDRLRATKTRLEAGLVALDPTSGDIKAWVGSRDFSLDQYDHVARARRQPGSTFKPFVYGAAIENGMSPDKTYIDKVVEYRAADGVVWRPQDIGTPTGQAMTATQALIASKNTITAQVMQDIGPAKVGNFARRAGVRQSPLAEVPSLALGTSPTTLLEMAAGYGTIANSGMYQPPVMVTRVEDDGGRVLVEFSSEGKQELSRSTAETLIDMMRGVVNEGTGRALRSQFGIRSDVAGKTGTTQDNADGWFIMMHPRLVVGAWVGFNDARVTMRSTHWGQGAHNALPVAGDFFQQATSGRLIDVDVRFPRARDTWPGSSIWGPPLDWIEGLFDQTPAPVQPSESRPIPKPVPNFERSQERSEESIDDSPARSRESTVEGPTENRSMQRAEERFPREAAPDQFPERPPAQPPSRPPGRVAPPTEFERAIEEGRDTMSEVRREWNNVTDVVNAVGRLFD
ncbi:MAG: transglycosylase domain-containing protein [Pseudomonadota bacterium]